MPVVGLDGVLASDVNGSWMTSALTLLGVGEALEANRARRIAEGRAISVKIEIRVIKLFFAKGVLWLIGIL